MDIIISNSSNLPIYEQITQHIKNAIMNGELHPGSQLPSIRALAADLRISVITTKRAYAELEAQGFIETRQGRGSFVSQSNIEFMREERLRHIEELLDQAIAEAGNASVSLEDLHAMLDAIATGE